MCGGLRSVDKRSLNCEELRWVRLEVDIADFRRIPRLISVVDRGQAFPVGITIEGDSVARLQGLWPSVLRYSRLPGLGRSEVGQGGWSGMEDPAGWLVSSTCRRENSSLMFASGMMVAAGIECDSDSPPFGMTRGNGNDIVRDGDLNGHAGAECSDDSLDDVSMDGGCDLSRQFGPGVAGSSYREVISQFQCQHVAMYKGVESVVA